MPDNSDERRAQINRLVLRDAERPIERKFTAAIASHTSAVGIDSQGIHIHESRAQHERRLVDSANAGRKTAQKALEGLTPAEQRQHATASHKELGASIYEANRIERQAHWTKQVVADQASHTQIRAAMGLESTAKGAERVSTAAGLTAAADGGAVALTAGAVGAASNAGSSAGYHLASKAARREAASSTEGFTTENAAHGISTTSPEVRREFASKTADWADVKKQTRGVGAFTDTVGAVLGGLSVGEGQVKAAGQYIGEQAEALRHGGDVAGRAAGPLRQEQNLAGAGTVAAANYVGGEATGKSSEAAAKRVTKAAMGTTSAVTKESTYQARADVLGSAFQKMDDDAQTRIATFVRNRKGRRLAEAVQQKRQQAAAEQPTEPRGESPKLRPLAKPPPRRPGSR